MIAVLRNNVQLRSRERVLLSVQNVLVVVLLENGQQANSVPVIANSSSVVNVTSHIEHSVPRIHIIFNAQEHL